MFDAGARVSADARGDASDRDIDLVLITGAGASCEFGVNQTRLPLMGEWSDHLVSRLEHRSGSFLRVTGLERGMDGPAFEGQLGKFLRSIVAFGSIQPLLEPLSSFPGASIPLTGSDAWLDWHRAQSGNLAQVTEVIYDSLYELFGTPAVDIGMAQQAYGALFSELGVGPGSRMVYATTNYDLIGERAIARLGGLPDAGDVETGPFQNDRIVRVDRIIDGIPRFIPVLHLHGRVGWFRQPDGQITAVVPGSRFDSSVGVPVVMLPDLEKDYASEVTINTLWSQLAEAVRRAKMVVVLGHSLHDESLIRTLVENVQLPTRLAVSVLASATEPSKLANDEAASVRERLHERLPMADEVLCRFDSTIMEKPTGFKGWAQNERSIAD